MKEIARTPYWIIAVDEARDLVRATRTPLPFPSVAEMEASFAGATKLFAGRRQPRRLLIDVREAPSRNDEDYESTLGRHRDAIFGGFDRVATLVKTVVGKLHVQRLSRQRKHAPVAFLDEGQALAFLTSPD